MSNTFGKIYKTTIFGASHDQNIGVVIEGLPIGYEINFEELEKDLKRRRPNKKIETPRIEEDRLSFISGIKDGKTTETPLVITVPNECFVAEDYNFDIFRPNTSDYSRFIKYGEDRWKSGSGMSSGRMTVALVIAGFFAKKILQSKEIEIISEILFAKPGFGSKIRIVATNMISGMGDPFFDSCESIISHMFFSIPAVKGINFGSILDNYNKDQMNNLDPFIYDGKKVKTKHNHDGGIQGGITNGSDILFDVLLKPIPTISEEIKTLNTNYEEVNYKNEGAHDKDISERVRIVLENSLAIVLYDLYRMSEKFKG